jgi:hypothetical protein
VSATAIPGAAAIPAGGDDRRGHDPAGETVQTTTDSPAYTWYKHFDYGLLRECGTAPLDTFEVEAWSEPGEYGKGLWHGIHFDCFNDSYSQITAAMAKELIGEGDLYAPNDDDGYWRGVGANSGLSEEESASWRENRDYMPAGFEVIFERDTIDARVEQIKRQMFAAGEYQPTHELLRLAGEQARRDAIAAYERIGKGLSS